MQPSSKLVLSAIVPFAAVWTVLWAAARPAAPTPITNVVDFNSHFSAVPDPHLLEGKEIWTGATGTDTAWFNAIATAGDRLLLVSDRKTVLIAAASDRQQVEFAFGADRVVTGGPPDTLWLQSGQGRLRAVAVANGQPAADAPVQVHPLSRSAHWLTATDAITNGSFEDGLLRRYALRAPKNELARALLPTAVGGALIFPGLRTSLARPLNDTSLAVRPAGDLLALAFKWSDRLQIYRTDTLTMERSIAGPVETKLDFAILPRNGTPTLSFTPDSAYSYVSVAADDEVVVALYSGKVRRRSQHRMSTGERLHLFSWDGRPLGVVPISPALQALAMHGGRIYGLAWADTRQPWIVVFDKRDVLAKAQRAAGRP
jgi:hypothetical protein